MTGRIGCARSKCSAVSPFMSGALPHFKSVITLLTNFVSKPTSVGNGKPRKVMHSSYRDEAP